MIDLLKKYVKSDSKILDAGCGTGGTMIYLKKAGFKNILGIDKSLDALEFCKKRKLNNVKLASVDNLPFKNESFDAIICLDVLYHKGVNPELVAREFFRVLKKGGIVYIQEPAYNWLKSKHDQAIETERRFTKGKISKILQKADFRIEKATYFNLIFLIPIIVKRIKEKFLKNNKISSDVKRLTPFLNKLLNTTLVLERQMVKRFNLPAGLSVITIAKK